MLKIQEMLLSEKFVKRVKNDALSFIFYKHEEAKQRKMPTTALAKQVFLYAMKPELKPVIVRAYKEIQEEKIKEREKMERRQREIRRARKEAMISKELYKLLAFELDNKRKSKGVKASTAGKITKKAVARH